jgi:hypothetical protein
VALAIGLIAFVFALGVPARGCGGAPAACGPVIEPPARAMATEAKPKQTIYLNRDGVTLKSGSDDAAHDQSSVLAGYGKTTVTIAKAQLDDATWAEVMTCVKGEFARFNIEVVDQRPAAQGYRMVVVGGSGSELGFGIDSRGDAPFDRDGCKPVQNAIAFVFAEKLNGDVNALCEVAAHEVAHTFAVDHLHSAADPMSHLPFTGHRAFQDADLACGEETVRDCPCGEGSQNPVQLILDAVGPAQGPNPPGPSIAAESAQPRPGAAAFTVHVAAPAGVGSVSLVYRDAANYVATTCGDGQVPCVAEGSTFTFTVPASGTASWHASVVDAMGSTAQTPEQQLVADGTPPGDTMVSAKLDSASPAALAIASASVDPSAKVTGATLYWTDARGITTGRELCASASGWSRAVQLSASAGARQAVVVATDDQGRRFVSAPVVLTR